MGLFRKKKVQVEEAVLECAYKGMTLDNALSFTTGEIETNPEVARRMAREMCRQLVEFRDMQEATREEFTVVTEYLADIQHIELLNDKERAEIMDTARLIINLDEERFKYQNSERRIPADVHRCLSMYEEEIPTRLKEMKKHEDYLALIHEDMHNLEGEKGSILYEKEEAQRKREFLRKASYLVLASTVVILITLILLMRSTKVNLVFPFLITGLAAAGFAAYYFTALNTCRSTVQLCDRKLNRATQLLNKIKIKYVNTTGALEYAYEKYHVNSYLEFEHAWEEFVAEKDEERRYRRNTQLLNSYQEELGDKLSQAGVIHTENWVHQPSALLSKGEMYDFKEGIGKRRRKLQSQLDFNQRQQTNSLAELDALKKKYSQFEDVIQKVMDEVL